MTVRRMRFALAIVTLFVAYALVMWAWPYLAVWALVRGMDPYRLEGPYIPPNAHARTVSQFVVAVTAYNCVREQTDDTWWITSSGMPCGGDVIAVSRDLLRSIPFGTTVTLGGKRYVVGDTMAEYWMRRVDIPMVSRGEAKRHGIKRKATLKVLGGLK